MISPLLYLNRMCNFNCGVSLIYFFFQAEDGIRVIGVTGVQTCALPICVMEDMNLLGVEEHAVQDQWMWKAVITCPTPS